MDKRYFAYIDRNDRNILYQATFAPRVDVDEVLANDDNYIEIFFEMENGKVYTLENGLAVENIEIKKERDERAVREKIKMMIEATNKYMMSDASLFYDAEFLKAVKNFRKKLMEIYKNDDDISATALPEMPIEKGVFDGIQ